MADETNTENTTTTTTEKPKTEEIPAWGKTLMDSVTQLADIAKNFAANATKPKEEVVEEPDDEEQVDATTLEMMPRAEYENHLLGKIEKLINGKLKPVTTTLDAVGKMAGYNQVLAQVNEFASATPDFKEWVPEMQKIAEQFPTLPVAEVYALAQTKHPEKTKEMREKYVAGKEKSAGTVTRPRGSGLAPSGESGDVKNTKMKQGDAAQDAWDKAVAAHGDIFAA